MIQPYRRHFFSGIALMLAAFLLIPAYPVLAQDQQAEPSGTKAEQLTLEEVDSHVAGMTDEQIRQAYTEKMKQDAENKTALTQASEKARPANKIFEGFYGAANVAATVLNRVGGIFSGEGKSTVQGNDVIAKLSAGKGAPYLFEEILGVKA
jgi:hypothetical protein